MKALSEELEDPLNVQRFRKLKGADPDSYEMTKKIEALQRRLITKTEEAVEQDVIIQQKEKNIQELRAIMKRQPQIEEAKQLSQLKESIRKKTKGMKASAAELNMFHAMVRAGFFLPMSRSMSTSTILRISRTRPRRSRGNITSRRGEKSLKKNIEIENKLVLICNDLYALYLYTFLSFYNITRFHFLYL